MLLQRALMTTAVGLALTATAALADKGSDNNGHGKGSDHANAAAGLTASTDTQSNAGGNSANAAHGLAAGAFLPGVSGGSGSTAALRLTNVGGSAGTATVTIYNATTGAELGTWTSPSVPALASVQTDISAIIAGATPTIPAAQATGPFNFGVRAGFQGTLQAIVVSGGVPSNASSCDNLAPAERVIGGVAGPGNVDLIGALRIVNGSTQARTVSLELHSATDGAKLGTWTSASIPAHATLTITTTALAAAASPVVPAGTVALTVVTGNLNGVRVDYLAQPKAGGAFVNLSSVCRLKGGEGPHAHDHDDAADANDAADDDGADAGTTGTEPGDDASDT